MSLSLSAWGLGHVLVVSSHPFFLRPLPTHLLLSGTVTAGQTICGNHPTTESFIESLIRPQLMSQADYSAYYESIG